MSVGILCDRVWKGYYVTNRKRGTKLHEEKSIQGSIALHIANLCRILIFRNVLWISDAEHGISMLDKYQNVGWKKFYLIYGMCDETFSVNCTTEVPEGVDKGWFMFFVTLLNQFYWVSGSTIGGLSGNLINFNTEGLDFVLTAMFVVIFLEQLLKERKHYTAIIGLAASLGCLIFFGADGFLIPSMCVILLLLVGFRKPLEKAGGWS